VGDSRIAPSFRSAACRLVRRLLRALRPLELSCACESLARQPGLMCRIAYNRHGGYCVPLSSQHRPAAQRILHEEVWESETIDYMIKHCGTGDVVHAGTYFGDFLPALSRGLANTARILAFEPNEENHRCSRITLELNRISNTVLTHAGLGSRTGTLLVRTTDAQGRSMGGASRIVPIDGRDVAGTEPVRIVTIDESVEPDRAVSIIQLDVEGYEAEALAGALSTIRRCRPILILEVLPGSTLFGSDWFARHVLSLGYQRECELNGNAVFRCRGSD